MTTPAPSFTDRLLVLFGAPNSSDDDLLMKEYQRLLKSYPSEIINGAVDRLARTHKYAGWPKIADCVAAAEDEIEARNWKERARNGGERPTGDPISATRLMARRFVNGHHGHGWEWSIDFQRHPWVVLAEKEGWGAELRASCIHTATVRFGEHPRPAHDQRPTVENVMPDKDTIAYLRRKAEGYRQAEEWRKANPNHRSIKGWQPIDVTGLLKRNREAFEAESDVTKRMTGDQS